MGSLLQMDWIMMQNFILQGGYKINNKDASRI